MASRSQADRKLYRHAVQNLLKDTDNLEIIEAAVGDITHENGEVTAIITEAGEEIRARAIVLTTGTFLGGLIHLGSERVPAGRIGEAPSLKLAETLKRLKLPLGRLKTGTPARLNGKTIAWDILEKQQADAEPVPFSALTDKITVPQIACAITRTNARTHEIISQNMHLSAVYSGQIEGQGPRYCPSIEDKVNRFAERNSHQIFLEPEGWMMILSIRTGLAPASPAMFSVIFCQQSRGWNVQKFCSLVMQSNMISLTHAH